MIIKAHAKINLGLNVLDKRPDGYHNLETIMLPLTLHDTLDISLLPEGATDDFVTCDEHSLKVKKYNLCHKAIDIARDYFGFKQKIRVDIHKSIFLQSGLGGGSADAAATVKGIIKILKIKATDEDLLKIGIQIGSDVPWSMFEKPAIVKEKGEILEFFQHNRDDYVLLVQPHIGLSTQEVFEESDKFETIKCDINKVKDFFVNDEPLKGNVINGLQEPSFTLLPILNDLNENLNKEGFDFVMMTGSGSCIYCFTKDKKLAKKCEEKYFKAGYDVELTSFKKEDNTNKNRFKKRLSK